MSPLFNRAPRSHRPPTPRQRVKRRSAVALVAVMAVVVVFAGRLIDIQVVQAQGLDTASADTLTVTAPIYAQRGEILGDDGTVLASTDLRYDVNAAPNAATTFTQDVAADGSGKKAPGRRVTVAQAMAEIGAVTGTPTAALVAEVTADKKSEYASLVKTVTVDEYQKIQNLAIPYVYFARDTARVYPDGAVAGNLVGFTGDSGPEAGLELQQNSCLTGTNGQETHETGADGVTLPNTTTVTKKATNGGTVTTTIDPDLQYEVEQDLAEQTTALGATSSTAVVMKVSDASLLSVADYPTVDPDDVSASPAADRYSAAFTDLYEPGSTVKALTAATLLDTGKATPSTQESVPDTRIFPFGGRVSDAEAHPIEKYTLTGILANSSNVGITMVGDRLSAQTRYDYLEKFGLGHPSGVDFPGEPTAALRPVSQWDAQTNENEMFGQGISATAIQMADAYQAIANHGVRIPATLVKSCTSANGTVTKPAAGTPVRVVSASTADSVVKMLETTMQSGTLATTVPISGYSISTKSGTAQVADAPGGGYGDDYITSIAAMAPAADPQYVVFVTFTKPTVNKTSAGVEPAFREIMTQVLQKYQVTPNDSEANLPTTW